MYSKLSAGPNKCLSFKYNRRGLTYLVEVEGELSRDAAVESCLEVSSPVLREDVLPASVPLADPSNPRVDTLAAVDVLHGCLTKEEENVLLDVKGSNKVRL